ncbi:MAG: hypothetical protein GWO24_08875, partial [Akkermansiaceae bacterium]|nr:hypothetical protein [Akkermansiaceae bacterium]
MPGNEADLDRSNPDAGSFGFELVDADGVELANLRVRGAQDGIHAANGADSDGILL